MPTGAGSGRGLASGSVRIKTSKQICSNSRFDPVSAPVREGRAARRSRLEPGWNGDLGVPSSPPQVGCHASGRGRPLVCGSAESTAGGVYQSTPSNKSSPDPPPPPLLNPSELLCFVTLNLNTCFSLPLGFVLVLLFNSGLNLSTLVRLHFCCAIGFFSLLCSMAAGKAAVA